MVVVAADCVPGPGLAATFAGFFARGLAPLVAVFAFSDAARLVAPRLVVPGLALVRWRSMPAATRARKASKSLSALWVAATLASADIVLFLPIAATSSFSFF